MQANIVQNNVLILSKYFANTVQIINKYCKLNEQYVFPHMIKHGFKLVQMGGSNQKTLIKTSEHAPE